MAKCKYCNEPIKWKYLWGKTPTGEKNIPFNIDGSEHNTTCEVILRKREEEPFSTPKPIEPLTGKPTGETPPIAGVKTEQLQLLGRKLDLILKKLDDLAEMI